MMHEDDGDPVVDDAPAGTPQADPRPIPPPVDPRRIPPPPRLLAGLVVGAMAGIALASLLVKRQD